MGCAFLALIVLCSAGCSASPKGNWKADTNDHYPTVLIRNGSAGDGSTADVLLIEGFVGSDLVSYQGGWCKLSGDDKAGWTIDGDLDGKVDMQGHPHVNISINPDGKSGTLRFRGSTYKITPGD